MPTSLDGCASRFGHSDRFAEANLYLATHAGTVFVSGLTLGDTASQAQIGLGDVFLATFDAEGVNR